MRRHGWGGEMPVDDAEARRRIVDQAHVLLRERPHRAPSISDVAEQLSVTRQTVYRYFPSTQALLAESLRDQIELFLADIAAHLGGTTDPATAVVEGVAFTYEEIGRRPDLSLLVTSSGGVVKEVTSSTSLALGRAILEQTPIDWARLGYTATELDELVEQMLRTLQSLIIDPGSPPRSPADLRRYLHRWLGRSVDASD